MSHSLKDLRFATSSLVLGKLALASKRKGAGPNLGNGLELLQEANHGVLVAQDRSGPM